MTKHRLSAGVAAEAAVALFFFGCIAVVVKFISANPFTIGIARLAITVAVLAPLLYFTGRLRDFSRSEVGPLALIGAFFACHLLAFFFGIKIGSASVAAVGLATYGIHLIVLSWFFQHSRITLPDVLLIAMAVGGTILVVPEFNVRNREVMGLGLGVLSGFFYAFLPILHQQHARIPAFTRALGQFAFGLLTFLLFWPLSDWHLEMRDWWGLLFLGTLCTLLGHTLWVRVTTVLSTKTTSIIYYLYVPVSLVLSVIVLDERVDAGMIAGAGLIIMANIIGAVYRRGDEGIV